MRSWATARRMTFVFCLAAALLAGSLAWLTSELLERREFNTARIEVSNELRSNAIIVSDLQGNAAGLAGAVQAVATSVRHPDIKILATLFPSENLLADAVEKQSNLYNEVIDALVVSGLVQNTVEVQRAAQACSAIASTIERTQPTISALADLEKNRYQISTASWQHHRAVIVANDQTRASELTDLVDAMLLLRRNYSRVAEASIEYLAVMLTFCRELNINRKAMSEVLATERRTLTLLLNYLEHSTQTLEKLAPALANASETNSAG